MRRLFSKLLGSSVDKKKQECVQPEVGAPTGARCLMANRQQGGLKDAGSQWPPQRRSTATEDNFVQLTHAANRKALHCTPQPTPHPLPHFLPVANLSPSLAKVWGASHGDKSLFFT